jgi:hypothetical protein
VTVSAAELGVHRLTAFAVPESDRAAVGGHPSIAPLHERDQCGEEIGALLGETVSVAGSLPGVAVGLALEQALLDELSQPRGGDGLADPDTARPLFSFLIAGRLIARLGAGRVIAIGSTIFAAGIAWWALAVGLAPDYVGDMLGGMLGGIGVGLTLPTLMATGASSLPAPAFATGSAVINMLRQVGLAIGVAVLGAPATAQGRLTAFHNGWWVIAAIALVGAAGALAFQAGTRAGARAGDGSARRLAGACPGAWPAGRCLTWSTELSV